MNQKVVEMLTAARDQIADPELWLKRQSCKTLPDGRLAMCAGFALIKVTDYDSLEYEQAKQFLRLGFEERFGFYRGDAGIIAICNDDPDTTHDDIMWAYNRAIELATIAGPRS